MRPARQNATNCYTANRAAAARISRSARPLASQMLTSATPPDINALDRQRACLREIGSNALLTPLAHVDTA